MSVEESGVMPDFCSPPSVLPNCDPLPNVDCAFSSKDYDGPCRETAQGMLRQQIKQLRQRADGLEAILNSIGEATGSVAEEALWELLCQARRGRDRDIY